MSVGGGVHGDPGVGWAASPAPQSCTVTAASSVNCRRVSAGSLRCSVPWLAMIAPVAAPAAAPIAAPVPPPAMPPTIAPSPAPPPTLRAVFLPSPEPFCSTCVVTTSYLRPPNEIEFAFSAILSEPFILPACSTLATWRTIAAPRGTMTLPSTITGSSSTALNVWPALVPSTSMPSVSTPVSAVPLGSVIGFGALAGSGAGGGAGCRTENSTELTVSTGNSAILPLASSTRTIFTSALMKEPVTAWPLRSFTESADATVAQPITSPTTLETTRVLVRISPLSASLGDRQRRRDLQIEQEEDLVFDLEEAGRGLCRDDGLQLLVVLRLGGIPTRLEIERHLGEPIGGRVGQLVEGLRVLLDAGEPLVVDLLQLRLVLAVDRPELGVLGLGELHHLRDDRDFLCAQVRAQQLDVGAQVPVAGLV